MNNAFDEPGGGNDDSEEVNSQHFVELKEFIVIWGEDERDNDKESVKGEVNDFIEEFAVHEKSIAEADVCGRMAELR